ncbi:hypothetical protein SNEBB_007251 [Seison nebaliae]|nr:hypothetical protein SNEBB_007251 [Seison nebaliae]
MGNRGSRIPPPAPLPPGGGMYPPGGGFPPPYPPAGGGFPPPFPPGGGGGYPPPGGGFPPPGGGGFPPPYPPPPGGFGGGYGGHRPPPFGDGYGPGGGPYGGGDSFGLGGYGSRPYDDIRGGGCATKCETVCCTCCQPPPPPPPPNVQSNPPPITYIQRTPFVTTKVTKIETVPMGPPTCDSFTEPGCGMGNSFGGFPSSMLPNYGLPMGCSIPQNFGDGCCLPQCCPPPCCPPPCCPPPCCPPTFCPPPCDPCCIPCCPPAAPPMQYSAPQPQIAYAAPQPAVQQTIAQPAAVCPPGTVPVTVNYTTQSSKKPACKPGKVGRDEKGPFVYKKKYMSSELENELSNICRDGGFARAAATAKSAPMVRTAAKSGSMIKFDSKKMSFSKK